MGKTKYAPIKYSVKFEIPFAPKAKERARTFRTRFGVRSVTPIGTRTAESNIRHSISDKKPVVPLEQPVKVVVTFFVEKPKGAKRFFPSVRPDLDNYIKTIFDAFNGVIWKDDGCVVDLWAFKRYTEGPPKIVCYVITK